MRLILFRLLFAFLIARCMLLILQPVQFVRTVNWCFAHPCWPRRDIMIIIPNHFLTRVPLLHGTVMAYHILWSPAPYTRRERWMLVGGEYWMDLINGLLLYPLQVIWLPHSCYHTIKRQTYERCRA
jgi:hypothetical protein